MADREIVVGDVVFVEGASALLGDVSAVDEDGVTVVWRRTETCEQQDDLELAPSRSVVSCGACSSCLNGVPSECVDFDRRPVSR